MIFQFVFIAVLELLAFSVAMIYLFNSSPKRKEVIEKYELDSGNKTEVYKILMGGYIQ